MTEDVYSVCADFHYADRGGEIMTFGLNFLDIATIVLVTVAVVDLIKKATDNKLGDWYTLISAGVGAVIYAIGLFTPEIVQGFIAVGLIASGLYVIKKT